MITHKCDNHILPTREFDPDIRFGDRPLPYADVIYVQTPNDYKICAGPTFYARWVEAAWNWAHVAQSAVRPYEPPPQYPAARAHSLCSALTGEDFSGNFTCVYSLRNRLTSYDLSVYVPFQGYIRHRFELTYNVCGRENGLFPGIA